MIKDLSELSASKKKHIVGEYYQGKSINDIAYNHNLFPNEILSILKEKSVHPNNLKKVLPTFDISDNHFIIISDTHIGSTKFDTYMLSYAYKYAKQNGIKHVIHAGDLIQSTMRPTVNSLREETKQLFYTVENYPDINGITTHILFGNHDFHTLMKEDEYVKVLATRKDFDLLGFKRAYFTWNKYLLSVRHDVDKYNIEIPNVDSEMMFCGHRHEYYVHGQDKLMLPCLCCDVKTYHSDLSLPGFIEVYLFKDKLCTMVHEFPYEDYENRLFKKVTKARQGYSRKLIQTFKIKAK